MKSLHILFLHDLLIILLLTIIISITIVIVLVTIKISIELIKMIKEDDSDIPHYQDY